MVCDPAAYHATTGYAVGHDLYLLTLSNSFKMFDQNYALTGGAPGKATQMLALDIYNTFYGSVGNEGVGQAKAVLFFLLVALVALVQLRLTRSREAEV